MILRLFINISLYFICVRCSVNYCDLPCEETGVKVENTACKCELGACSGQIKQLIPDKDTKDFIVKTLNDLREKVASGSESLPAASNMAALVYDDDVEFVAECHAKKCLAGHDQCRRTSTFPVVGQNFYMQAGSGASSCSDKNVFKAAIDMWYDEIKQAPQSCIDNYSGCAGHFTQIIWANSTNVGCGRISFGENVCHIVCNFGPAGNTLGLPTYRSGIPTCELEPGYSHLCKSKSAPPFEGGASSSEARENKSLNYIVIMFLILAIAFFV